ncbi:hypothetical protein FACS1894153_3580 [Bacteroidia bacterium]|nr:hypothetical protein FACS1894153_3580 [Bacteroidia bacterium]
MYTMSKGEFSEFHDRSDVVEIGSCTGTSYERTFLAKYEFEDFSQFNNVSIFYRGQNVIFIDAPNLVYDTERVGVCVIILDKNNQIIETKWTLTENNVNADTVKLQQLAQIFMKYEIPRLNVDKQGNVFVYLKDFETLALARFVNESELQKRSKETKWVNVTSNWYKRK